MAKKVQLKDNNGNKAYPVTSSACVGMSDGSGSLDKKIAGMNSKISYVTCTTGAGTAAKTVSLSDFALTTGIRLVVKMSYANTAASATLNVNNTGAKTLYYNGNPATADNTWEDGETLDVYYDGTNYQASNVLGGSGSGGNMILEWDTDAATTRLQVKLRQRKKGMSVTYVNDRNETVNEQYIKNVFTDNDWKDDNSWVRYSMYNDSRISAVRNSYKLVSKTIIPSEGFNVSQFIQTKLLPSHRYAVYIETDFPTKSPYLNIQNLFIGNLTPSGDVNLQNGYLVEATLTGGSVVNSMLLRDNSVQINGSATVYIYDLGKGIESLYASHSQHIYDQTPLNYRKIYSLHKTFDLSKYTNKKVEFYNSINKRGIGDSWLTNLNASYQLRETGALNRKLLIQVVTGNQYGNSDVIINLLTLRKRIGASYSTIFSISDFESVKPGYFYIFEPDEDIDILEIYVRLDASKLTVSELDLEVNFYAYCTDINEIVCSVPRIKHAFETLGIKDNIYELIQVDSFNVTTTVGTEKRFRREFQFEEDTIYCAKIVNNNSSHNQIAYLHAVQKYLDTQGQEQYANKGYYSSTCAADGIYLFASMKAYNTSTGENTGATHLEYAFNNQMVGNEVNADITVYKIRLQNNVYDGSVNITYPTDKKLPVGLTRVDITSDSITVKEDKTLTGIPCENADFKYTFDNGKVFQSKALVEYQGNSSMNYIKKNLSVDLLDEESESVDLRIGKWIPMDSYHLKANWVDSTHAKNIICARVMEQIYLSRGERPWDAYNDFEDNDLLGRIDTGALGHIDGFPIEVYVNGTYIGLYTFNLKKHRSNYNMKKNNTNHIQMEMTGNSHIDSLPVQWNRWEIRNPKSDSGNEEFEEGGEPAVGEVRTAFERLATFANGAVTAQPTYSKDDFKDYLNIPFWLDFILFSDFTDNRDGITKNTQLCTWDGIHWSPLVYDMDLMFGVGADGKDCYGSAFTNLFWSYNQRLMQQFSNLFKEELRERYIELRSTGIFSVGNINYLISEFMSNIGEKGYEREHEIWTTIPSNGGSTAKFYESKKRIIDFVSKKLIHMDLKYGLICDEMFL